MNASLSSLVDNLVGTNTDCIKCCEEKDVELVEINSNYLARFECKGIKTRQLVTICEI